MTKALKTSKNEIEVWRNLAIITAALDSTPGVSPTVIMICFHHKSLHSHVILLLLFNKALFTLNFTHVLRFIWHQKH